MFGNWFNCISKTGSDGRESAIGIGENFCNSGLNGVGFKTDKGDFNLTFFMGDNSEYEFFNSINASLSDRDRGLEFTFTASPTGGRNNEGHISLTISNGLPEGEGQRVGGVIVMPEYVKMGVGRDGLHLPNAIATLRNDPLKDEAGHIRIEQHPDSAFEIYHVPVVEAIPENDEYTPGQVIKLKIPNTNYSYLIIKDQS